MKILCIWSWLPHEHEVSFPVRDWKDMGFQLKTYVASLNLHASIAEITAQAQLLFIFCVAYLI